MPITILKHFYISFLKELKIIKGKKETRQNLFVKVRTGKRYDTRF
jgi:hypothetical protein